VIVGFPGESEEDFQETVKTIESASPEIVNISKYGDRPGTLASTLSNKVSTSTKKARSRKLFSVVSNLALETNSHWIGWTGRVIATEGGVKGGLVCRNWAYRRIVIHDSLPLGEDAEVRILSANRTYFTAAPLA
jgi:tRNA A37 methylthiotransferase MiaB